MDATIKALLAKTWKNEDADLAIGRNYIDEEFVVRINGSNVRSRAKRAA